MLASPLYPTSPFSQQPPEDSTQYRPVRDLEAFNSLLPPPIEFVEGSSSGTLAIAEGKYEAINATPKATTKNLVSKSHGYLSLSSKLRSCSLVKMEKPLPPLW
ncbi:hypothetical protein SERLA73DRAFT_120678 [Serpula lacrymans var. lacrymans S7.3]|uniref:Uncharacterized protein n=1 Tax=Serpula lacrymans var. lacrymans (strain S7.3) TaxID=936435 RepID=F8PPF4_SERL3|nr:hypothetical protein SERLA73DRAFT_120678 [Serpula lacrymans var. lacrymans S7.3]